MLAPILALVSRWFGLVLKRCHGVSGSPTGRSARSWPKGRQFVGHRCRQPGAGRPASGAGAVTGVDAGAYRRLKAGELYNQAVGLVELFVMLGVLVIGADDLDRAYHPGRAPLHSPRLPWSAVSADPIVGQSRGVHRTATASAERVAQILTEPIVIADDETDTDPGRRAAAGPTAGAYRRWCPGDLLRRRFRLPRHGKQVFDGFSPALGRGRVRGVGRPQRRGKTSATHLLLRFYDPVLVGSDRRHRRVDPTAAGRAQPHHAAATGGSPSTAAVSPTTSGSPVRGLPTRRSWPRPRPLTHAGSSPSCRRGTTHSCRCGGEPVRRSAAADRTGASLPARYPR